MPPAARWIVAPPNEAQAAELGQALGLSALSAQLLLNRGVDDPEEARRYLEPKLQNLRRPDGGAGLGEMAGFKKAVTRLERALSAGETIGIFGDYDVDGVSSCALLTLFLRAAGARVVAEVARRDAG